MCCNHLFIFTIYNSLFSLKREVIVHFGLILVFYLSPFLTVTFTLYNPPIPTIYNSLNIHLYMNSVCLECPFPLLPTKVLLVNFKTEMSSLPLQSLFCSPRKGFGEEVSIFEKAK